MSSIVTQRPGGGDSCQKNNEHTDKTWHECQCPDLLDAIRALIAVIDGLHDELRAMRLALPPPPDIGALIALHQRTKASYAEVKNCP